MVNIINTEFQKIRRYHIMLIGLIGMVCSPLLQLFSQAVMAEEYKNPDFDFGALVQSTIWGNATIFMPVIITLIGGYLINREYTDDTLKNILTVPVSYQKYLAGKMAMIGLLGELLGIYGFAATVIISICAGLPGIDIFVLLRGLLQTTGLSFCIYIVVLPVIAVCSRRPGLFMGGAVIAFILGYCCMFFKKGLLRNIYPFSAALTVIGFDLASYTGTSEEGSIFLGTLTLSVMFVISVLVICISKEPGDVHKAGKRKKRGRKS